VLGNNSANNSCCKAVATSYTHNSRKTEEWCFLHGPRNATVMNSVSYMVHAENLLVGRFIRPETAFVRIVVAEAQTQFRNLVEGEHLLLKARGQVK
jgi:hypothetical protein